MHKTKHIQKANRDPIQKPIYTKNKSNKSSKKKPIVDEKGDPLIKNLSDFVTSIKINYSNKPIYTGGRIICVNNNIYSTCNGQVVVYNIQKGQVVNKIKYMDQQVVNFAVNSQQKHIITFTQNAMLRCQSLVTNKITSSTKLSNQFANDIQFSPDSRHVAIAFGNTIHIFTFETMKRTHTYNPTNSKFVITKLMWNPIADKLQIISVDLQRNIVVFDYIINKVIAMSEKGNGGTDCCINKDGTLLVAVNNRQVKLYDAGTMALRGSFQQQQYFQCVYIVQNMVFLGGQQSQLLYSLLLNSFSLSKQKSLKKHNKCTDNGVAKLMACGNASSSSFRLLVLSTQQNISIISLQKNQQVQSQGMIIGYNDQIIDIKNSKIESVNQQDESPYFVMVTNSNNVKLINKKTNKIEHLITGHTNTVLCADYWHPFIATGGKDNILKLWRINDQNKKVQHLANYNGHSGDIVNLVALPKSKIIATVSQDNTIKLWSMALQVSEKVQIKSAIRTTIAHNKSINSIRASQNQQLLATCSQDRTLKIFNINLTCIMTLVGHRRGVWDAAFHPVQKLIVSVAGDGTIKGWNLQNGENIWSLGEGQALIRCAFMYYNQVVTGSQDGIVKIWDIRKQTSISYDKHEGKIWALDIHKPKNKPIQLYTGATDSVYHIWQDNTEQMKTTIMHNSQLQQQQRIFYNQHLLNKRYTQAAIVAFKAGYTKLFMQSLGKIGAKDDILNKAVQFDEYGKIQIVDQQQENAKEISQQQFVDMVKQLKQIDINRLLLNIQSMSSTIKHYKISNRILLELLKLCTFSQLSALNSSFMIPEDINATAAQFNQKKSALTKWLQSMISYEQKHLTRLNKYIVGTHWIQNLYRKDNPYQYQNNNINS